MIRKKIFTGFISIFFQFGVNVVGLPADTFEIAKYAQYKYINTKR